MPITVIDRAELYFVEINYCRSFERLASFITAVHKAVGMS